MLLNLAAMAMANPGIMGASTPDVVSNATVVNDTVSATSTGAVMDEQLSALVGGFSSPILSWILRYLHIDPRLFIPILGTISFITFAWQYIEQHALDQLDWFMCTVQLRPEDEIYAIISSWIAAQPFAQKSKSFVVNSSSFNSRRFWDPYWWWDDKEDEEDQKENRALFFTPAPGNHYFWYQRRLLIFRRKCNREGAGYMSATEREEISISCFGRDPWVLKKLLHDAYMEYNGKEDDKTLIYRGVMKQSWGTATWQKSISKASRPFNTVVLNEKVKEEVIQDIKDYLSPATRRWYANRGIPYRRGYLLHGPPGTGKSSLSLALAGYFKMRIYIVSLSSIVAAEENLSTLFADLPRKCIVLLEDIDTAGLTHTREGNSEDDAEEEEEQHGNSRRRKSQKEGKLSLSGLLNILDGVASQEGRILIMTTNHVEKLDKALIRPGRVDMQIKFDRADNDITAAIFRAMYGHFDNEQQILDLMPKDRLLPRQKGASFGQPSGSDSEPEDMRQKRETEYKEKVEKEVARINELAVQFAEKVPVDTFSPAELQGYLLKNKRTPEKAIEGIEQWCKDTIKEREEKEKKEAEEKKKREEKRLLRKEKKKKREERRLKEAKAKAKARGSDSESDGSDSNSDSASESEEDKPRKRKMVAKARAVKAEGESESDSTSSDSSSEEEIRKKRKSKGRKSRKAKQESDSENCDSSSEAESSRRKKTKKTKRSKGKSKKASKEDKPAKAPEEKKTDAAEVKVVIEAEDTSDSNPKIQEVIVKDGSVQDKGLLSPSKDSVKGEADSGYETPSEEGSVSSCRVVLPSSPSPLQEAAAQV